MGAGHLDELDHVEWDGIIFQKKSEVLCKERERCWAGKNVGCLLISNHSPGTYLDSGEQGGT